LGLWAKEDSPVRRFLLQTAALISTDRSAVSALNISRRVSDIIEPGRCLTSLSIISANL
jgi:hypothetical protein